jgi:hypothetical protein
MEIPTHFMDGRTKDVAIEMLNPSNGRIIYFDSSSGRGSNLHPIYKKHIRS